MNENRWSVLFGNWDSKNHRRSWNLVCCLAERTKPCFFIIETQSVRLESWSSFVSTLLDGGEAFVGDFLGWSLGLVGDLGRLSWEFLDCWWWDKTLATDSSKAEMMEVSPPIWQGWMLGRWKRIESWTTIQMATAIVVHDSTFLMVCLAIVSFLCSPSPTHATVVPTTNVWKTNAGRSRLHIRYCILVYTSIEYSTVLYLTEVENLLIPKKSNKLISFRNFDNRSNLHYCIIISPVRYSYPGKRWGSAPRKLIGFWFHFLHNVFQSVSVKSSLTWRLGKSMHASGGS